ncbi:MAG TPA: hypothetical protein VMT32_14605 [Bryobacteraceae bacterium]|nr:hypothetical protein [Bryobacteraceae bacterium]
MKTWKMTAATVWVAAGAACYGASHSLTIVVIDMAGAPPAVLAAAGKEAQVAFRAASVETSWTVCQVSSDPAHQCVLPPAGTYMQVKIVAKAAG